MTRPGRQGLGTNGSRGVRLQVVLSQETVAALKAWAGSGTRAKAARLLIEDGLEREAWESEQRSTKLPREPEEG